MASYHLTEAQRRTYRRYAGLALPRHTSYPTATAWKSDYGPHHLQADLEQSTRAGGAFSLYVHVPYCERLCYYCACTKEIVPPAQRRHKDPVDAFLRGLHAEAGRFVAILGRGRTARPTVRQFHLGGGSPTFLNAEQLEELWTIVCSHFYVAGSAEVAIEADPRITSLEQLQTLRGLGFNRISLGIQDFAPPVQRAVNRVQPFELVGQFMDWCRALHFDSVNFDLIYGLPFQTLDSMADTLEKTVALSPDRIAFYRLAVIPELFRWQRVFDADDLPAADLTLDLNLLAINHFLEAGYEFVGLDHFAKPQEALARAAREGSLHRTFQGMSTGKGLDILGLGPSAITQLDHAFAQNMKTSQDWFHCLRGGLATERGLRLSHDDRLRRELLQQLYGHGVIDKSALEQQFGICFDDYFRDVEQALHELVEEGVVWTDQRKIGLTAPLGRLLVRVVAALFDRYLPPNAYRNGLASHLAGKVG